eukprot:6060864-Amphidinium_carterae.1
MERLASMVSGSEGELVPLPMFLLNWFRSFRAPSSLVKLCRAYSVQAEAEIRALKASQLPGQR